MMKQSLIDRCPTRLKGDNVQPGERLRRISYNHCICTVKCDSCRSGTCRGCHSPNDLNASVCFRTNSHELQSYLPTRRCPEFLSRLYVSGRHRIPKLCRRCSCQIKPCNARLTICEDTRSFGFLVFPFCTKCNCCLAHVYSLSSKGIVEEGKHTSLKHLHEELFQVGSALNGPCWDRGAW